MRARALLAFKGRCLYRPAGRRVQRSRFRFCPAASAYAFRPVQPACFCPLDLMQPYRLEMGIRPENAKGKDLYHFWGDIITDKLNAALHAQGITWINLASDEYFKSVKPRSSMRKLNRSSLMRKTAKSSRSSKLLCQKKARGSDEPLHHSKPPDEARAAHRIQQRGYFFDEEASGKGNWCLSATNSKTPPAGGFVLVMLPVRPGR